MCHQLFLRAFIQNFEDKIKKKMKECKIKISKLFIAK